MRQPGDDFRVNPFEAIRPKPVGNADVEGALANQFSHIKNNTYNSLMLKYCGGKCYNLGGSSVNNEEGECMNQCQSKYSQAMSSFEAEKKNIQSIIGQIKSTGGNVYDARDI